MPSSGREPELQTLEERIQADAGAREALCTLRASEGVDEHELWRCLEGLESSTVFCLAKWGARSPMTKRDARKLARRLKDDAAAIRGFFTDDFYWLLTVQLREYGWLKLVQKHLCMTARLIEEQLQGSDDRGAGLAMAARERLTNYVREATGKPHDREVADLIRVVLNREAYSAEEQRKFRTRPRKSGHN